MSSEYIIMYPLLYDGTKRIGPNITGAIYLWTENNVPCYVGLTKNKIYDRINNHLTSNEVWLFQRKLRKNPSAFRCYLIYNSTDIEWLNRAETYFIKHFNTYIKNNPDNGYNLTEGGDATGEMPEHIKQKIRVSTKGNPKMKWSPERKLAASLRQKGKPKPWASKNGKKNKGRVMSDEVRQKMSNAHTGKKHTDETRQKIIESNKKRKYSIETIEKMRQSAKNRWKKNIILT